MLRTSCRSCCVNTNSQSIAFSVQRLGHFHEYCQTSSRLWCLFVIFGTPLPTLGIVTLISCMPLADPFKVPWYAQKFFFFRVLVDVFTITLSVIFPIKFFIRNGALNWKQQMIVATYSTIIFLGTYVGLSAITVFPIPFGILTPSVIAVPSGIFVLYRLSKKNQDQTAIIDDVCTASMSQNPYPLTSTHRRQVIVGQIDSTSEEHSRIQDRKALVKYAILVGFQIAMIFCYPFFAIGFMQLQDYPLSQISYTLLLPMMKYVLGRGIKKLCQHVEDLRTENYVFSVEFFNALFKTMCLGNVTSMQTTIFIMTMDLGYMWYWLQRVIGNSKTFFSLRNEWFTTSSHNVDIILEGLLFAQENKEDILEHATDIGIRWNSSSGLPFRRSSKLATILNEKVTRATANARKSIFGSRRNASVLMSFSSSVSPGLGQKPKAPKIGPIKVKIGKHPVGEKNTQKKDEGKGQAKARYIKELLYLVSNLESIVLVEYVEAFVPFSHALYLNCLYYSSNKPYIHEVMSLDKGSLTASLTSIVIYGFIELGSLLLLYAIVKYRYGINLFYLLAFVLETNFMSIQTKLYVFLNLVAHFGVVHFGMDFTFQFEWLRKNDVTSS